jgi:putative flippase GtrA
MKNPSSSVFKLLIEAFIKYAVVGGFVTCLHYAIFLIAIIMMAWVPWQATILASTAGAFFAYFLNYQYTFSSPVGHLTLLPKFLIVALIGILMQTVTVAMLNSHWHIHYLLAQLIATCVGLILTFLINNFWTFT